MLALPDGRLLLIRPGASEILLVSAQGQRIDVETRTSQVSASSLSCSEAADQTLHMVADGTAAAGYCPFDGTVWWLDLARFEVTEHALARIGNPFWGAPTFSPDGRLLYVYDQWDGYASVLDLVQRRLLRSTRAIQPRLAIRLPFVRDALAKGPNYSAALSGDGETLFVTGAHGSGDSVYALATSDWAIHGLWLQGRKLMALWAGSEAAAVFAMEASANALHILDPTTGKVLTVERGAASRFAFG
jgi:hypothetical protein